MNSITAQKTGGEKNCYKEFKERKLLHSYLKKII